MNAPSGDRDARLEDVAEAGDATLGHALAALRFLHQALDDPDARTRPLEGEGADALPRLPDRYRDVQPIGRGGMGIVLRAFDSEVERPVAIKVLRARSATQVQREKFLLEAKVHANLEHPGIVPIHEIGRTEDGRDWFSMKLVRGRTLAEVLAAGGPAPLAALLGIHLKICEAVAFAHSRGVLHRDLKPGNVMIGEFGEVMLMDWGLAKVLGDPEGAEPTARRTRLEGFATDLDATRAGEVLGTPGYMSPEQAGGDLGRFDHRTDVYGLGAILYEMVAGRAPFHGIPLSDLVSRVAQGRFPPPRAAGRAVPRELEEVVLRAMARDPDRRYQTVGDMAADLVAFLEGRTLSGVRYGTFQRVLKWARRHKTLAAAAAAILAVTAGAALTVTIRERSDEARRLSAALARDRERVHLDAGRRLLEQMRHSRGDLEQSEHDLDRLAGLAEADFRRALDEVQDDPEAMLGIAETRWLARRPETAIEWIEQAIAVAPSYAPAYALRVRCRLPGFLARRMDFLGRTGPGEGPDDPQRRAIEEDLREFERHAEREDEVHLARGLLALSDGDHGRAVEDLSAYLELYPGDADAHGWLGAACFRLERFPEALGAFVRAQRGDVRAAHHAVNVCMTLQRLGRFEDALRSADVSVATFPDTLEMHFVRGSALQHLGRLEECQAEYDRVLAGDPGDLLARVARGCVRRDRGDLPGALADFDRAIELQPGVALPRVNRGVVRVSLGDRTGARDDFDEAIRLDPGMAEAWFDRGLLRFRGDDPPGGLADFDRAIELAPGNVRYLYERARTREATHDLAGACADYDSVLAIEPGRLEARIRRGRARANLGDLDGAIGDLEEALRAAPEGWVDRAEVERALALLRADRK